MSVPRVAALLGKTIEAAGLDDWRRLVEAATPEGLDLDFKRLYSTADPDFSQKFATDIAAFANAVGGVIVVGVEEQKGAAGELFEVSFDEALELKMSQAVANHVFPKPSWRIQRVQNPTDSTRGLLLCVVPRSRLAPHAVLKDPTLRYPVRRNARAEFLAEHEVAERYRQRFVRGEQSESRLAALRRDGPTNWPNQGVAHVEAVLLPLEPGELRLTSDLLLRRQREQTSLPREHSLYGGELSIGFRRLRLRDFEAQASAAKHRFYAELHSDGTGYAARVLRILDPGEERFVQQPSLFCIASELLEHLSKHAADAGCVGDALLSLQLVFTTPPPRLRLHSDPFLEVWDELPVPTGPFLSEQTIPLARSATDSMLVLRSVLTDWVQSFGVPETDLINADGTIDAGRWNVVAGEDPEQTIRRRGSFPRDVIRR